MSDMALRALAPCIGFGIGAVACWVIVVLISTGRFRRNGWLGMSGQLITRSEESWRVAHMAARPWILVAAVSATLAFLLTAGAVAVSGDELTGSLLVLTGLLVGLLGVVTGSAGALVVANRAAEKLWREEHSEI